MNSTLNEAMKVCPFCNGEAKLEWYERPSVSRFYWVSCTRPECQASTPTSIIDTNTPDGPIAWWNRRASTPASEEVLKMIADLLAMTHLRDYQWGEAEAERRDAIKEWLYEATNAKPDTRPDPRNYSSEAAYLEALDKYNDFLAGN